MRALVLTNLYPPHALGGYERACADVVRRWRDRGHDVAVLTSVHRVDGVTEGGEAGVTRTVPVTSLYTDDRRRRSRFSSERAARRAFDDAVDRFRPEVLAVWNMAGIPLSLLPRASDRSVPMLLVVADSWPVRAPQSDPWIAPFRGSPLRRAIGRAAARATGIPTSPPAWDSLGRWAFCSQSLRDSVARAAESSFPDAAVVPLGVDTDDFPLDETVADVAVDDWRWRVLFVGRIDPMKGIDTLLRAVAALPEGTSLRICAPQEPEHLARVGGLTRELGIERRVHLATVDRADLAVEYRAADVVVFPSEWEEPFGIVPLEAMACATPVVASGTGGSGEYLRADENCLLAAPGDPQAVVTAIERLAGDAALRARLIQGGHATASAFTTEHLAERLEALALELC